ncbi:MAG: hydrophobe/amphiphile efflux-1 family RND transporter [Planctomycetota bacterium]|nr:MAG: hydrophobe/amphiphile efflux-1 family RND transporter [Planctomycetota bacterium]REK37433.1 MAG: hydrophobe/amphiphile efflux-1 family RND transporter [Planctomycetota bacterium]
MFSIFFINRPIFACVVSIVIMIAGAICLFLLPVEQTPDITPPTVVVTTTYRGASADTVAKTVAVPIEREVNGVEDSIYMSSKSSDDGTYELTITFEVGTDIDMATVLVQNRVAIAQPLLPQEVKREGVKTEKRSTNMVLMVNIFSPDGSANPRQMSTQIDVGIKDELARLHGVGKVVVMGAKDYAMRIWLDPGKLRDRGLTTSDVIAAVREQNVQIAAGQIAASPYAKGAQNDPDYEYPTFEYTVSTQGRFKTAEEFRNLIVKVGEEGRVLRLSDIARIEVGALQENMSVQLDRRESVALAVYQLPGANALEVRKEVGKTMVKLAKNFPDGMAYTIAYDTTMFVEASIAEVVSTLVIAVILVVLTVYVFLQDVRTTIIPAATIPVALIGTLGVMFGLGMSINTLSLFGLVLAIGIVVDDAIVVVENTMRLIDDEGLSAKEATAKAMIQVTGPVVATTLVLLAVFIPTALMPGITGRLYRQFAITIATATVFSSVNALTLSPALCGMLLRPSPEKRGPFFAGFNKVFDWTTRGYMGVVNLAVRRTAIVMLVFLGFLAATAWSFMQVPGGFLPDEDQGYLMITARLPDGSSLARSTDVGRQIEDFFGLQTEVGSDGQRTPKLFGADGEPLTDEQKRLGVPGQVRYRFRGVANVITVNGYSALDALNSTNAVTIFVVLKNWAERKGVEDHVMSIVRDVQQRANQEIYDATTLAFIPPPITGLGTAGGFEYQLLDKRAEPESASLQEIADALVATGNSPQVPELDRMNSNLRAVVPQLYLDIDFEKAKRIYVPRDVIAETLQANLGSYYVNDFEAFGRIYKVMMQAEYDFRNDASDIARLEVRNLNGDMVPLSTVLQVETKAGPKTVYRYKLYPSSTITGQPGQGYSSGQAVAAMEQLSKSLPSGIDFEWSGVTLQQLAAGNLAPLIFGFAIVLVYLFLAAQYESWGIPWAVIFSVPLAVLGGMGSTYLRSFDNNIYTQIGLVLLIGLASKSAILIVEFAKQEREEGRSIQEAAARAAELRFRAILMTAFSFILGVLPLVIASGAGAASRVSLGTVVAGGMTAATVLGVFFIPTLYVVVQRASEAIMGGPKPQGASLAVEGGGDRKDEAPDRNDS